MSGHILGWDRDAVRPVPVVKHLEITQAPLWYVVRVPLYHDGCVPSTTFGNHLIPENIGNIIEFEVKNLHGL